MKLNSALNIALSVHQMQQFVNFDFNYELKLYSYNKFVFQKAPINRMHIVIMIHLLIKEC